LKRLQARTCNGKRDGFI